MVGFCSIIMGYENTFEPVVSKTKLNRLYRLQFVPSPSKPSLFILLMIGNSESLSCRNCAKQKRIAHDLFFHYANHEAFSNNQNLPNG